MRHRIDDHAHDDARRWLVQEDCFGRHRTGRRIDMSVYDVYRGRMTSKELIALLKQEGWTLRGSKGSHRVFVHPSKPGHLTVPHPKKDLGTGLVQKILRQAGLK